MEQLEFLALIQFMEWYLLKVVTVQALRMVAVREMEPQLETLLVFPIQALQQDYITALAEQVLLALLVFAVAVVQSLQVALV
jgi:hypothetical protein